jgi:hypothetical protein
MALRNTLVIGTVGFLVLLVCDGAAEGDAAQETGASAALPRPSVLFAAASTTPVYDGWVDLTFLSELKERGFEVDFTQGLSEITWERIRNYNVLVISRTPDSDAAQRGQARPADGIEPFVSLMERYLSEGGGVLLMPREGNSIKQSVADLTDRWGAILPVEKIVETDPTKVASMTRLPESPVAYTDQIVASPLSEGVRGIWYPMRPIDHGHMTGPILVDESWHVVVKASETSITEPIDLSEDVDPPHLEHPFQRPGGVEAPALFAIRSRNEGRIALVNQWNQFSYGAGTKWLYDREILSRGFDGRPSDFGRLLENTFRWLAKPSLGAGTLGGYRTAADRLAPPNESPEAREEFEWHWRTYGHYPDLTAGWRLVRGLLGAKTAYSSGTGTVPEFAAAAREAGLDFVVFLEDFDRLTEEEFRQLRSECSIYSDEALELIPGFTIDSNIGNRVFHIGQDAAWLPPETLTGPNQSILYLQEEDGEGGFTGSKTYYHRWVLKSYGDPKRGVNVGYYDFSGSGNGMRPPDLRNYSLLGLRTYRQGRLVEDVTPEYLTTALSTIPPGPVSINEVRSPVGLRREVESGHALTYALRPADGRVAQGALSWSSKYASMPLFVSDGPKIIAWPQTVRVATFGSESFTSQWTAMRSLAHVRSDVGLKEVRIYDGERLFRRFLLDGDEEFRETLVLDGTVQRNLVLIAEDVQGGRAVSFARRSWKVGTGVEFCSDRVNSCSPSHAGTMVMIHGANQLPLGATPGLPVDVLGGTWDGGPTGTVKPVYLKTRPLLDAEEGSENGGRFNQTPVLEFSDEGARAVASVHDELFDDRIAEVMNGWNTRGPLGGPSKLFRYTQRFRHWFPPSLRVPSSGWPALGVRLGVVPTLYSNEIVFKRDLGIRSLQLGYNMQTGQGSTPILVVGDGSEPREIDLSRLNEREISDPIRIEPGHWFGIYARGTSNSHAFVNRAAPILLSAKRGWLFVQADLQGRSVQQGDVYRYEVFGLGYPIDVEIESASDFRPYLDYLAQPTGLEVLRGRWVESAGLLEIEPVNHAVEVSLPKPDDGIDRVVPLRVPGLNPRWSTGVVLKQGYVLGYYGRGENRYRAAGLDFAGDAYIPLYPSRAERTHVVVGHPIAAGPEGRDLFIQVTKLGESPFRWHVSVNNPTDRPIETFLHRAMDLPDLEFPTVRMRFEPGEYRVLVDGDGAAQAQGPHGEDRSG